MEIIRDCTQKIGEVQLFIRIEQPRTAQLICNPSEDIAAWIADHTEQLTAALKVWRLTPSPDSSGTVQS